MDTMMLVMELAIYAISVAYNVKDPQAQIVPSAQTI